MDRNHHPWTPRPHAAGMALTGFLALALLLALASCGPKPPAPHATIYATTQAEIVAAIDASTGAIRWTFHGAGMLETTLSGATLYAASSAGVLYALDARTGKARWHTSLAPQSALLQPLISGDILYVVANHWAGSQAPNTALVYAVSAATGARRWQATLPGAALDGLRAANGLLYVSEISGQTGAGETGMIAALRMSDGTLAWRASLPGAPGSALASDGARIYVATADGAVLALRTSDGELIWRQRVAAWRAVPLTAIALSSALLYVGSGDGVMHTFRVQDGAPQWTRDFPTEGTIEPDEMVYVPSLANGTLYLTSVYSPSVYALSPGDGADRWSYDTLGYSTGAPPVALGSALYVIAGPAAIDILDAQSGGALATYDFSAHRDLLGIQSLVIGPPIA